MVGDGNERGRVASGGAGSTTTAATWIGLVVLLLSCSVSSPRTEIVDALARAAPLDVDAGPARITLTRARFADVEVAADGGRAQVLAVVDADGRVRLDGAEVALGYVGREAFELERCARARWCPAGSPLPALAGVVTALAGAPRGAERRPIAWQIRIERDRALVGEDAAGPGGRRAPRGVVEVIRDGAAWRLSAPGAPGPL